MADHLTKIRRIVASSKVVLLTFALYVSAAVVVALAFLLMKSLGFDGILQDNYGNFILSIFFGGTIVAGLAFINGWRWGRGYTKFWQFLKLKMLSARDWRYVVCSYLAYFLLSTIVFTMVQAWLPMILDDTQVTGFSIQSSGWLFGFVAIAICIPIYEELLMRGWLYTNLKLHAGQFWATIIASLVFAGSHLAWNVSIDTFVLSLVIIFAYEKTKNLSVAVMIHAFKNIVAFVIPLFIELQM